jgi:glutathione S-transferase
MRIAGTSLKPLEVWRRDVDARDALDFGRSLAVSLLRGGSGALATMIGPRPKGQLVLYERETCPYSRLVREALTHLDLDALIKPCPPGEWRNRGELHAVSGDEQVPFLVDQGTGVMLRGSQNIVQYLFQRYGTGDVPIQLRPHKLAELTSRLASEVRGKHDKARELANHPAQPLELWSYEASPYSRLVRERLGELGLPYVCHNLGRRSPRRPLFVAQHGRAQFPLLHDPNTNTLMFESADIMRYLDDQYAPKLRLVAAIRRLVIVSNTAI